MLRFRSGLGPRLSGWTWPKCFDYLAQVLRLPGPRNRLPSPRDRAPGQLVRASSLQCRATDPLESGKFFFANRDTGQPGRVAGSVGLGSKQPGPDTLPAIQADDRPPELAPLLSRSTLNTPPSCGKIPQDNGNPSPTCGKIPQDNGKTSLSCG